LLTYYYVSELSTDGLEGKFYDRSYNLFQISLRNHNKYMIDASWVQSHPELFMKTEVTGCTLILELTILKVLESFPLDVIYLFYQGVVFRVLVPLFAGTFWRDLPVDNSDDEIKVLK